MEPMHPWRMARPSPPGEPCTVANGIAVVMPLVIATVPPAPTPEPRGAFAEWGELMAAAHDGHGGAYHRLLSELSAWLRRYYARRLPPSAVDDVAQEALAAIHAKRHTYEPSRPFGPWLTTIARYKWIDHLRAMGRSRTEPLDDEAEIAVGDHGSAVTSAIVLADLLAQLKPAQSEVIRLVKLQGFSVEEAAQKTGQSISLVKVNIHRGLAKLALVVESDRAAG